MREGKKSFILYIDTLEIADHLSDQELGKFFRAIIHFQKNKNYELPRELMLVFELFKKQFIRDENDWTKVLEAKSLGGKKSAELRRLKKNRASNCKTHKDSSTHLTKSKGSSSASTVNVNGIVNENVNANKKRKSKEMNTSSPLASLKEIEKYFFEKTDNKNFSFDHARKFFDHYESNGWKVGKNPMKRWKNSVNGWINRQHEFDKEKNSTGNQENTDTHLIRRV